MAGSIFTAVKPEKVKVSLIMESFFYSDIISVNGSLAEIAKQMIAKGWVRK